jgi:YidC/Oxa1 family membrane protein insertase
MDRSSILRFLAIGGIVFLFLQFVWPKINGSDGPKFQPLGKESALVAPNRPAEDTCILKGTRFTAEVSTRGAALKHFFPEGQKYTVDGRPTSQAMDLVTTPDVENRRPLRVDFRGAGGDTQVDYDLVAWTIASHDDHQCVFAYSDDKVELKKTVRTNARAFELEVDFAITNKRTEPAKHRAAMETTAWRTEKEIAGGLGRQSPFLTQVECGKLDKLVEKTPSDFAPKDFGKPEFKDGWFQVTETIAFVATSNFYFAQALVPIDGPGRPICELQIEDRFSKDLYASKKDDPNGGSMYRSRLSWPAKELAPNETASYKTLSYMGPKEREVLATAGGGNAHLSELIHLGFFSFIAKYLVGFLVWAHKTVGSWGVAIILLTLMVRTLLFPLTWKTIKSGAKMRQMKPELDELNKKYADDAQQKQLATMELYKKHGVNPVAGCFPMLIQMPVWFALYTSIQTAAELFHTPFLWFHDLSAPDTVKVGHWEVPFILPLALGATTFIQQKIMPQQMDAAQQKMMTYVMPAVFTAMMLFLPSGLGVYMFTNSLLGIVQQLAVERYYASQAPPASGVVVRDVTADDDDSNEKKKRGSALGKGDARV